MKIFFLILSLCACSDPKITLKKINNAFDKIINESYFYEHANTMNATIVSLFNNYLSVILKIAEFQYNICIKYECQSGVYSEEFYKKILVVIEKIYDKEILSTDIEQTKTELKKLNVDYLEFPFTGGDFSISITNLKECVVELFNFMILDINEIKETLDKYSYNFSSNILQLNDTQVNMTEVLKNVSSKFTSKVKKYIFIILFILSLMILFFFLKLLVYIKVCHKKNSAFIEKVSS